MKTQLTPENKIKAAYLSVVCEIPQHVIAIALEVSNVGRVNEAITQVKEAVGLKNS